MSDNSEKIEKLNEILDAIKQYIDEKCKEVRNADDPYYHGQVYEAEKILDDVFKKFFIGE